MCLSLYAEFLSRFFDAVLALYYLCAEMVETARRKCSLFHVRDRISANYAEWFSSEFETKSFASTMQGLFCGAV